MTGRPLESTVARNVLAHGTGGINVDGCRVEYRGDAPSQEEWNTKGRSGSSELIGQISDGMRGAYARGEIKVPTGRFPANVLLSHSEDCTDVCDEGCPLVHLDAQSGTLTSGVGTVRRASSADENGNTSATYGAESRRSGDPMVSYGDSVGASRFFPTFRWEAKAPTSERPQVAGVSHPTTKPVALMRWLVRLVCPPGGIVVDPFAGSGTTGHAARAEGVQAVLIEREAEYLPLITARLDARDRTPAASTGETPPRDDEPMDLLDLLDGEAS